MTDDELKELIASLAIDQKHLHEAQQKTDAQISKNSEEMRRNNAEVRQFMQKTDEETRRNSEEMRRNNAEVRQFMQKTDEEMRRNNAEVRQFMQKTDEEIRRNSEEVKGFMQKTDEQMNRTDERLNKIGDKLDKVGELVGNMGRNHGDVTEEFFYNSLLEDIRLGNIRFDNITKSLKNHCGKTQEEYDIVMTNGVAVGIVEIKYKAHENDLDKLERKMRNFKKLYPRYHDCKIYGALAAFNINETAKKTALERGFFVLQRNGKILHTDCAEQILVV